MRVTEDRDETRATRAPSRSTSPRSALAVVAALVLVVGFFALRTTSEAASVEQAVPGLVERLARGSWAPVAADDPEDVKAAAQASELARIDQEVPETWAASKVDEMRTEQEQTLQRALLVPGMTITEQRIEIVRIANVDVDGDHATVDVEWFAELRSRPNPADRHVVFSWEVDEAGWRVRNMASPNSDDHLELVREDGQWRIAARDSLLSSTGA